MDIGVDLAWSAPIPAGFGTRDTSDPLGFRGWANALARELVPGLTQVTWRTRGYSLLCKGLMLARKVADNRGRDAVDAFLRFERLWVGAQRAVHGERARWAGVRMAALLLAEANYRLTRPLTSDQLSSGLWGAYRRSAVMMGLIEPQSNCSGPAGYRLTSFGRDLGQAVSRTAFTDRVRLADHILKDALPREYLQTLIAISPPGEQPSESEVQILSKAASTSGHIHDRGLERLRRVYDQSGTAPLNLDALVGAAVLSDSQRIAAEAAKLLLELMIGIEKPYRQWVTGQPVKPIPRSIWLHHAWDTVHRWPVPELVALHNTMRSSPSEVAGFDSLHQHHSQLMNQRGVEPWDVGVETPTRLAYQAPDFCLGSASRLFAEGFLLGVMQ